MNFTQGYYVDTFNISINQQSVRTRRFTKNPKILHTYFMDAPNRSHSSKRVNRSHLSPSSAPIRFSLAEEEEWVIENNGQSLLDQTKG